MKFENKPYYNKDKLLSTAKAFNMRYDDYFIKKLPITYSLLSVPVYPFVFCDYYNSDSMIYRLDDKNDNSDYLLELLHDNEIGQFNEHPYPRHNKLDEIYSFDIPLTILANNLDDSKKLLLSNLIIEKGNSLENALFASRVNLPYEQKLKHINFVLENGNASDNCLCLLLNNDCDLYQHYDKILKDENEYIKRLCKTLILSFYGFNETQIKEFGKYNIEIKKLNRPNSKKDLKNQLQKVYLNYLENKNKYDKYIAGVEKHF